MDSVTIQFIIGLVALVVWAYVISCLFFRQIVVDRILSRGRYWHIVVIFLLVALVPFALASVGMMFGLRNVDLLFNAAMYSPEDYEAFLKERQQHSIESPSLLSAVLYQFRGFGSHFYAGTESGKVWALVIGILGTVLFSGLLIPSVLSVIRMRSDNWTWGKTRYNIQHSPYAVIIGASDDVPELIHKLLSSKKRPIKYVIVQTTQNVMYYRIELQQHLTKQEEFHTILYHGGRETAQQLRGLHLERATEVYVLSEIAYYESEADHDSLNVKCIGHIAEQQRLAHRKTRLQCYVQFDHASTFMAFQFSDLSAKVREQIEFIALNKQELWAQRVLVQSGMPGAERYLPLEGSEVMSADNPKHVHLVVVGFSRQGVAMAVQAAHVAHYPNFVSRGIRTRITIIDAGADKEKDVFMSQYENLFDLCRWRSYEAEVDNDHADEPWHNDHADNFLDLEWEFVKGRLESDAIRQWLSRTARQSDVVLTLAICFRNPQLSMVAAFNLPREVYRHAVQVLVWQNTASDVINGISGYGQSDEVRADMRYSKLHPFGMSGESYLGAIIDYRLAKLINYAYWRIEDSTLAHLNEVDPDTGLPNQESFWRQASVVDQWSSNHNAVSAPVKMRAWGLDLQNTPIEEVERCFENRDLDEIINVEHNRWNVEKLLTGYRALTADEKAEFARMRAEGVPYSEYKKHKKRLQRGWEMAHLDICSMAELREVDAPAVDYDLYLTRAYPAIVKAWRAERRTENL